MQEEQKSAYERLPLEARCQIDAIMNDNAFAERESLGLRDASPEQSAASREAYAQYYSGESEARQVYHSNRDRQLDRAAGTPSEAILRELTQDAAPSLAGEKGSARGSLRELQQDYEGLSSPSRITRAGRPKPRECGPGIS